MPRVEEEVLLGPGFMFIAPHTAGVPEPLPPLLVADTVNTDPSANWLDVGFSEDGWSFAGQNVFSFWTPAELVDPVVTVKDSAEYHFRGVMAQWSLENLKIALSGGTIVVDTAGVSMTSPELRSYIPALSTDFDYVSALFITEIYGFNETSSEPCVRHTYIPWVVSVAEVEVPHTKGANPSLLGIDLQAIKGTGDDIIKIEEQREVP